MTAVAISYLQTNLRSAFARDVGSGCLHACPMAGGCSEHAKAGTQPEVGTPEEGGPAATSYVGMHDFRASLAGVEKKHRSIQAEPISCNHSVWFRIMHSTALVPVPVPRPWVPGGSMLGGLMLGLLKCQVLQCWLCQVEDGVSTCLQCDLHFAAVLRGWGSVTFLLRVCSCMFSA